MAASRSKTFDRPEVVRRQRRPLWKYLLRASPLIVTTIVLTVLVGRVLELDHAAVDLESRWRKPTTSASVVMVQITEEDYENHFGATSPLNPAKVAEIIDAIADGKPRLIGVDLDTSHHDYAELERHHWPSIVWMQGLIPDHRSNSPGADSGHHADPSQSELSSPSPSELAPGPVKGMDSATFRLKSVATAPGLRVDTAGLAVMAPDSDGLIRRYQRCWKTRKGVFPSFVWAVATSRRDADAECASQKRPSTYVIKYGQFRRWGFSAGQLLEQPRAAREQWLKDKIVLLGGAFTAARDVHATPLGQMLGIDILAEAVETELSKKENWVTKRLQWFGDRAPDWLHKTGLLDGFLFVGLLDGYLLLVFFYRYQPMVALLLSVVSTAGIVVLTLLIVPGLWLYVAMVCITVLAFQLMDVANDYRKQLIRQLVEPQPVPTPTGPEVASAPASATGPILAGLAIMAVISFILGRRSR